MGISKSENSEEEVGGKEKMKDLEIKVVRDEDEFKSCIICNDEITRTGDYYIDIKLYSKNICVNCVQKISNEFNEW